MMKMFCFPFAGGNKYAYQNYVQLAPDFMKVVPVELPGRGTRSGESLLTDIYDLADDVFNSIRNDLHKPYVLYGHSMGGLLVYLVTKKIINSSYSKPAHLFITGCTAPSMRESSYLHMLPKADFIQELKVLGGCPDEILNNQKSMEFFEPVIRADFKAVECFRYKNTEPFDIPITVMYGMGEYILPAEMAAWQNETTASVDIIQLPGNHFFIHQYSFQIIKIIARKINHQLQKL